MLKTALLSVSYVILQYKEVLLNEPLTIISCLEPKAMVSDLRGRASQGSIQKTFFECN